MENDNNINLKDEIVGAIVVELDNRLGLVKEEIFVEMDNRFRVFKVELKNELKTELKTELKEEIMVEMDKRFEASDRKMEDGFRHQGILLEEMQDDIDTLVDGQEALHERIDRLHGITATPNPTLKDWMGE